MLSEAGTFVRRHPATKCRMHSSSRRRWCSEAALCWSSNVSETLLWVRTEGPRWGFFFDDCIFLFLMRLVLRSLLSCYRTFVIVWSEKSSFSRNYCDGSQELFAVWIIKKFGRKPNKDLVDRYTKDISEINFCFNWLLFFIWWTNWNYDVGKTQALVIIMLFSLQTCLENSTHFQSFFT